MNSCWFEMVPHEAFDEDMTTLINQFRATKYSSKIHFYRHVRDPLSVQELVKRMNRNHLVWMDGESFIVTKKMPKTVPRYPSKFRAANMSIDFEQKRVHVYGVSKDAVSRTAGQLLCLKDEQGKTVRIWSEYSTLDDHMAYPAFIRSEFLHKFTQTNPRRLLRLDRRCLLCTEESIALASHPDPLQVDLECMFQDGGLAFTKALSKRTSEFGTLSLQKNTYGNAGSAYSTLDLKHLSELKNAMAYISLETNSWNFKPRCLLSLSFSARHIEYKVFKRDGFDDIEPFRISTRGVTLIFVGELSSRFHTLFVVRFMIHDYNTIQSWLVNQHSVG
jgi:hypothetical protein